jgi:hypothetical protein
MSEPTLDWSTAEVKESTLTVQVDGDLPDGWADTFNTTVKLLGGGSWGEIKVEEQKAEVSGLTPGTEEKLKHFLESVVQQANATHSSEDEEEGQDEDDSGEDDDGDEDSDEESDSDKEMAEQFRSFAEDGDSGDDDSDDDEKSGSKKATATKNEGSDRDDSDDEDDEKRSAKKKSDSKDEDSDDDSSK